MSGNLPPEGPQEPGSRGDADPAPAGNYDHRYRGGGAPPKEDWAWSNSATTHSESSTSPDAESEWAWSHSGAPPELGSNPPRSSDGKSEWGWAHPGDPLDLGRSSVGEPQGWSWSDTTEPPEPEPEPEPEPDRPEVPADAGTSAEQEPAAPREPEETVDPEPDTAGPEAVPAGAAPRRSPTRPEREPERPSARPCGGEPPMEKLGDRFRVLLVAASTSVALSYLAMVLVAAVAGLTASAGPAPGRLLGTAVPLWLAAHQVPLVLADAPLGALPLLPTIGVIALVARAAATATTRLGGRLREDASVVVATLAGTHASVAVLATSLPSADVRAAPWAALLGGGLVAAAGAGPSALRVTGPPRYWSKTPDWLRVGLAGARIGGSALAVAGALMLLSGLLVASRELYWSLESSGGFGAALGLTLLSLCYLPNALVASVSWVAGPGVTIGAAAASPLFTSPGPLPQLPLMAVMPSIQPPGWTVVVFILPVLAGALVGRRCRQAGDDPVTRLSAVAVAAITVAVGAGLLAAVVGGRLAGGPFDPVDVPAFALASAVLAWLGVPAVAVALLPSRPGRLR
ncbi:DUF6350 family protein [Pseudonocardia spinosispora]|uniref:cell division protein PerM n=1 Tax=Pseudonocardia spinosispora TaxID=103441 RepID=UPI0004182952|nr:DUF6350 family protein [Pseudonocardia spinosispora]